MVVFEYFNDGQFKKELLIVKKFIGLIIGRYKDLERFGHCFNKYSR